MGPFAWARISGLSLSWVQNTVFTVVAILGLLSALLGSATVQSRAECRSHPIVHHLLSRHRAVVWKYSRQVVYLERLLPQTSVSCLVQRSDYWKSLPGDFIRICLKIEQNCRLFLDIFSSAIMNDLFMAFTSRLKVDAKSVYQQWNWVTVANYFGTPPADWVHGYLYFEPGAWIWKRGSDVIWILLKSDLEIFH